LNLASLGASSRVLGYVNEARGWFGAELTYLGASVRTILAHKNRGICIQYDEEPVRELEAAIVCVANGQYFGAGIHVNPRGKVDDGLFDIIEVSGTSRLALMNVLRRAQSGQHIDGSKHVLHRTCRSVKVWSASTETSQAEDAVPRFETDGEIVASIPASFRIIPGGIRIRGL
jgi:diacylglycerol kinase family enzyme